MKEVKRMRVRVVDRNSAKGFEEALNDVLNKVEEPDIKFDTNRPFLAYITYVEYVRIPESIQDAYNLRGEIHRCNECEYYQPSSDRRVKYSVCALGNRVYANKEGCELLYKTINEGRDTEDEL